MSKERVVYKYDLDCNFICSYKSTTEAARDMSVDESTIRRKANNNDKFNGFFWSRIKPYNNKLVCVNEKYVFGDISDTHLTNPNKLTELISKTYIPTVSTKEKGYNSIESDKFKSKPTLPKILILDIETSPLRAYVWQLWKQNISLSQTISNFFMLTWSAKWLNEETIMSERLTGQEALEENDSRITKKIWKLLNECDIAIAHNGVQFDFKKLNSRFILNGLQPTKPYRTIDTLIVAKQQFGFDSNSLNALANQFGIGEKIHTDFSLWDRCMRGNDEALEDMEKYNCQDVILLEKVYKILSPYIRNHPNLSLYNNIDEIQCPYCTSTKLTENGFYYTNNAKYITYRCGDCGAVVRGKKTLISKNKQKVTCIPGR